MCWHVVNFSSSLFFLSLITKWKWIQVSYQLSFACLPEYKKNTQTHKMLWQQQWQAGRQAGMSYMHTNKQIYRMERKCLNLKFLCVCVFVYDSMLNTHGIFFGCYGCIWMDEKNTKNACLETIENCIAVAKIKIKKKKYPNSHSQWSILFQWIMLTTVISIHGQIVASNFCCYSFFLCVCVCAWVYDRVSKNYLVTWIPKE